MILVDERTGSKELAAPLRKAGLDVEVVHLDFADVAFDGRGIGGEPLVIGVELKNLSDLVQSFVSERFAGHQLPGLLRTYDPDLTGQRVYLIVEGEWRTDSNGRLLRRAGVGMWKPIPGSPPASALRKRLLTLATRAGVTVWPTLSRADTVAFLTDLYRFWTDEDLDSHKSHLAIYSPDVDAKLLERPSTFKQVIAGLPGLGRNFVEAARQRFGSIHYAVNAPESQWAELVSKDRSGHGKRLGSKRAAQILQAITNKEN